MQGHRKACNQCDGFGTGAIPPFLPASCQQRLSQDTRTMQEHPNPAWTLQFVGGEAEQIDAGGGPGHEPLGDELGGVGVERDAPFSAGAGHQRYGLNRADFALPPDQGHQLRWWCQQLIQQLQTDPTASIHRPTNHSPSQLCELGRCTLHSGMFHR